MFTETREMIKMRSNKQKNSQKNAETSYVMKSLSYYIREECQNLSVC